MTDAIKPVARLIVRAPNWLGDAVMALPALAAGAPRVRRVSAIILAARASIAPLFEEGDRGGAGPGSSSSTTSRRRRSWRAARGDAILLLPNSFASAWTASRAGIAERWGFRADWRGWMLTRAVARPRGRLHHIDYYLSLARGLGIDAASELPRLSPRPQTLARADALLAGAGVAEGSRLVGFAPGAAYGHAKRWPPDRVAGVIAGLAPHSATAVLVGAAADRSIGVAR